MLAFQRFGWLTCVNAELRAAPAVLRGFERISPGPRATARSPGVWSGRPACRRLRWRRGRLPARRGAAEPRRRPLLHLRQAGRDPPGGKPRRLQGAWPYGSRARGEAEATSDVDVAVLFDEPLECTAALCDRTALRDA
ncbi:MAG: nucleotidyltransferase domain-containing protein [Planctomycetota bacterium]|nr:MAG: nucleotidyltransferase domain-containing protein [Planctomycetota bacterium]